MRSAPFGLRVLGLAFLAMCLLAPGLLAAEAGLKVELNEKREYRPPAPLARGKEYHVPASSEFLERYPIIHGWRLEAADGNGLAIGGISTRTEDPRPPTQIKRNGAWVDIRAELRAKNPLQRFVDLFSPLHDQLVEIDCRARYIYMEGRTEADEKTYLDSVVAPKAAEFSKKLAALRKELEKAGGNDAYCSGQAAFALKHLDQVLPAIAALGARTDPENLNALRLARVHLEQAADALDAEPSARGVSMPAYDAKANCAVLFGGDHFDYLCNDLWVFDFKAQRWQQRHPATAPEPRGDHLFESAGDGKFKMAGGFVYGARMPGWDSAPNVHAGPGEWTYDLAANAWKSSTDVPGVPSDTRAFRESSVKYLAGPRPNAAEHEKVLKALPANQWTDLKPSIRPWGRDWGTTSLAEDRDVIFLYSGGHCVYSGADSVEYHLATNRWDQPQETEHCSGYHRGGESVPGWSFNRHPWICGHSWNSYGYHPGLKGLVVNGRQGLNNQHFDSNSYVFDPDACGWTRTPTTPKAFDVYNTQVRYVPGLGMVTWYGQDLWKMDDQKKTWEQVALKGKLAGSRCDFSGLVYDPTRKRELFICGGGYQPDPAYSGEVFALAVPSLEVTSFKPQGSEHIRALYMGKENMLNVWVLREAAWYPKLDLFLFLSRLPGDFMVGLDAKNNRWVALKLPGEHAMGLSAGLTYDSKRDLFFVVDDGGGGVSALKIDPATVVIKSFDEYLQENPPPKAGK